MEDDVFGTDYYVNNHSELCVEVLDEPEKKTTKIQSLIYLRHWNPTEYELGDLIEILLDKPNFDLLINRVILVLFF